MTLLIPYTPRKLLGMMSEQEWTTKWGIELSVDSQVFVRLSREAYDDLPGVNQSSLHSFITRTPAHARDKLLSERELTTKKDFLWGSICHTTLFEPELLESTYIILPDDAPPRPTKAQLQPPKPKKDGSVSTNTDGYRKYQEALDAQTWWDVFDKEHMGVEIVSQEDYQYGIALANAVKKHPVLSVLIDDQFRDLNEITLTYIDPITKLRIKARLDMLRLLNESTLWIGDTKTTYNAMPGPDGFGKSIADFYYDMQAAFYVDAVFHCKKPLSTVMDLPVDCLFGLPILFEWIAIEKVKLPDYQFISRQLLSDDLCSIGRSLYRSAIDKYSEALLLDFFPAYSLEAVEAEIPGWARNKRLVKIGGIQE